MSMNLAEVKRKRFDFLRLMYESTQGDQHEIVSLSNIAQELNLEEREAYRIAQYLDGEHLIGFITMGGGLGITHYGVVEMERALSEPDKPTEHFLPINVIHVEHMVGSQIQQGTMNSIQTGIFDPNTTDQIKRFIEVLKVELPKLNFDEITEAEVRADTASIEAQLNSPKPKMNIVRGALLSLRAILEGIGGNLATSGLLQLLSNVRL